MEKCDEVAAKGENIPPEPSKNDQSAHRSIASEAYAWMVAGSFFFTCMGVWTYRLGVGDGPDSDFRVIAFFRSLIAFLAAVVICKFMGGELLVVRPPVLWLRSLAGSGSMVCTFYALTRLPTPEVLTLTNTYPLWIGLFSALFLREWPGWGVMIAALVGVCGVVLIFQPPWARDLFIAAGTGPVPDREDPLAVAAAIGASGFTAVAMMGLNRLKGHHPWAIVAHFSGVATIISVITLVLWPAWFREGALEVEWESWLLLGGVGLGATLGQWCLTQAFTKGKAVRVSIVGLSQVCFGILFDFFLYGRTVNPLSLCGMVMVLVPTAWIMSQRKG